MIPIHFGVTGHRDILQDEIPAIKSKLRKLITEYKNSFVDTKFLMLTMLAEGADRLAAEVALECGVELIAVSPMPLYEYEKDFSNGNSLLHFRSLWNRAKERIELPPVADKDDSIIGINRERQYASGGAFLAAHSQILIALWDGSDNGKLGGTAFVVKSKLSGDYSAWRHSSRDESPLRIPDTGPVYHIEAKREQNAGNTNNNSVYFQFRGIAKNGVSVIYPESWFKAAQQLAETDSDLKDIKEEDLAEKYYRNILLQVNQFNHDVTNGSLITSEDVVRNCEQLYSSEFLTRGQGMLLHLYGAADSLAIKFQSKTIDHLLCIACFSFIAFATLGVFDQFLSGIWTYALFWYFIVAAYILYFVARRARYEDKFYDYRALAEGIRVQLSWILAGISENVTDYYLEKYAEKIPWLLVAINNGSMMANNESDIKQSMTLVRTNWVDAQYQYYSNRISTKEASLKSARSWAVVFIGLSLTLAITIGIWSWLVSGFSEFKNVICSPFGVEIKPYSLLMYGLTLCLAAAGVRTFIIEKRALQDEVSQYRRMAQIFRRGRKRIEEAVSTEEQHNVLRELGKEALAENGDWLLYQRSKPLEMKW